MDKTLKTNGLKIRSWGDIAAIVTIMTPTFAMLIATVMWGLKLETELNEERLRTDALLKELRDIRTADAKMNAVLERGILPRAEERIRSLERRMDRQEK